MKSSVERHQLDLEPVRPHSRDSSRTQRHTSNKLLRSRTPSYSLARSTGHEDAAVEAYERRTGWSVRGSNDERYTWEVLADHEDPTSAIFSLVGFVDGLCDQWAPVRGDGDGQDVGGEGDWELKEVVVEIKNRTGSIRPPPLYDQIQCVSYMKMLGSRRCDLVEAFRDEVASGGPEAIDIRITPVMLEGPPYHGEHWDQTIMPRLAAVARAIRGIREDNSERLQWLADVANEEEGHEAVWSTMRRCVFS